MKKIIPKDLLLIIMPVEAVALNCLSVIKEKEKSWFGIDSGEIS